MSKNKDPFFLWSQFKKQEALIIKEFKNAFGLEWEKNIGNDCALISPNPHKKLLITKDILVEGVHFYPDIPLEALAYKSIMVNISDICADGGKPLYMLVGLSIPQHRLDDMLVFSKELIKVAKQFNISIIGGDTVASKEFSISITCIGEVEKPWLRKNAKLEDYIYVTGTIGASGEGLRLLQNKIKDMNNPFIFKHYFPPYNYPLVEYLQHSKIQINAAVDISDGFLEDLSQILLESETSCILQKDLIPFAPEVEYQKAYYSGEDYELIFTSPELIDIEKIYANTKINVTQIGKIVSSQGSMAQIFIDGQKINLSQNNNLEKYFHF